jgi:hypothetical protein
MALAFLVTICKTLPLRLRSSPFFLSALDYIPPPPVSLLTRCISSVNGGGSTPGNPAHPIKTSAKMAKANNILTTFFIPFTFFHFAGKIQMP